MSCISRLWENLSNVCQDRMVKGNVSKCLLCLVMHEMSSRIMSHPTKFDQKDINVGKFFDN